MYTGIDDIQTLLVLLEDIAPRWLHFGAFLIPNYSKVEAIKTECCNKPCSDCLLALLAKWLRGAKPSPSKLVKALIESGYITLAKTVAGKFGEILSFFIINLVNVL